MLDTLKKIFRSSRETYQDMFGKKGHIIITSNATVSPEETFTTLVVWKVDDDNAGFTYSNKLSGTQGLIELPAMEGMFIVGKLNNVSVDNDVILIGYKD